MFFMMLTTVGYAADSNVYVTQSDADAGLVVDIYIDGDGAKVGEAAGGSNDGVFEIGGVYNNVNIDLIGATNTVWGDFKNASGNSTGADLTIYHQGTNNETTLSVGSNTETVDVRIDENIVGSSSDTFYNIGESTVTCVAGDAGTGGDAASGDYTICTGGQTAAYAAVDDLNITVDFNTTDGTNLNITDISTASAGSVINVTAAGTGDNIDVVRKGSGLHNTTITAAGGTNVIQVVQDSSAATTATIDTSGGGSNINTFQSQQGNVVLDINGASANVDIVVVP